MDWQTNHTIPSVTNGRIYVILRCSLIMLPWYGVYVALLLPVISIVTKTIYFQVNWFWWYLNQMPENQLAMDARIDRCHQKRTVRYRLPGLLVVFDPLFSAQFAARLSTTPVLWRSTNSFTAKNAATFATSVVNRSSARTICKYLAFVKITRTGRLWAV